MSSIPPTKPVFFVGGDIFLLNSLLYEILVHNYMNNYAIIIKIQTDIIIIGRCTDSA